MHRLTEAVEFGRTLAQNFGFLVACDRLEKGFVLQFYTVRLLLELLLLLQHLLVFFIEVGHFGLELKQFLLQRLHIVRSVDVVLGWVDHCLQLMSVWVPVS